MPTRQRARPRHTVASRRRPSIYPLPGDRFLFVPTQDQWNVHEAGKPSVIGKRARLGKDFFINQVREYGKDYPWIEDYLYAACELPKDESAEGFEPTSSMLAFRKEARIQVILHAARRSDEQLKLKWA